jgi:hypothetical protein
MYYTRILFLKNVVSLLTLDERYIGLDPIQEILDLKSAECRMNFSTCYNSLRIMSKYCYKTNFTYVLCN